MLKGHVAEFKAAEKSHNATLGKPLRRANLNENQPTKKLSIYTVK